MSKWHAFWIGLTLLLPRAGWSGSGTSLQEELLSSDPAIAAKAQHEIEALSMREKRDLVLELVHALHGDPSTARAAAEALSHCGAAAENAVPALINTLANDDPAVTAAASQALIKIGPSVVPQLGKALYDENFLVRQRVATILANFGAEARAASKDLVVFVQDPHYEVQTEAANALVKIGEPAILPIEKGLKSADSEGRKRLVAILQQIGPESTPVLIDVLRKDDAAIVRVSAAQALGAIRPVRSSVLPALLETLKNPDDSIRTAVVDALGDLRGDAAAAIGPLIVFAHHEHDSLVRQRSLDAVAKIGPGTAASFAGFLQGLRDEDPEVRKDIVSAVGSAKIPYPQAGSLLSVAIKDRDTGVRLRAVEALAEVGKTEPQAIPMLAAATSDPQVDIKTAAIRGLGVASSSSTAVAIQALENALKSPDVQIRQEAIAALGNIGPAAIPALEKAKADADSFTQQQITATIKKIHARK